MNSGGAKSFPLDIDIIAMIHYINIHLEMQYNCTLQIIMDRAVRSGIIPTGSMPDFFNPV